MLAAMRGSGIRFANSDIGLAVGLRAAREAGMRVDLLSIKGVAQQVSPAFGAGLDASHPGKPAEEMFAKLAGAKGVILSTPVYFGDRSSVANKFLQLTSHHKLLRDKAFGVIAVGAKRNGGQETTLMYCLMDALSQRALAVGNGPSTCQYGGTLVAGDANTAYADDWGLTRAQELGRRVAEVCALLERGQADTAPRPRLNIQVLMTMDSPDRRFGALVRRYLAPFAVEHDFHFHDLIQHPIARCHACDVCPHGGKSGREASRGYRCRVRSKDDCVARLHDDLVRADAILIMGVSTPGEVVYRYQAFTERTRYLRRDNFQLTNIPIVGLLVEELGGADLPLHNIKVLTSYIRHNTILVSPLKITVMGSQVVHGPDFGPVLDQLIAIRAGRAASKGSAVAYQAEGYAHRGQDRLATVRK